MIRFLQLSDIHFHNHAPDDDDFAQMKAILPGDLQQQLQNDQKIDRIIICGDIAFSGEKSQYDEAAEFLDSIKEVTKCKIVRAVPGNHDLDRSKYDNLKEAIRSKVFEDESFLANCRKNEPLVIKALYSQFANYMDFSRDYIQMSSRIETKVSQDLAMAGKKRPELVFQNTDTFYWEDIIGKEDDYTIALYGVNTALLSSKRDKDGDDHRLQWLPKQMWNITRDYDKEIKLLMGHHPLDLIFNGASIKKKISSRFNVQFYGHVHKQSYKDGQSLIVQSGALMPDEAANGVQDYFPVYNIVELSIKNSRLHVHIKSRKWNGELFEDYIPGNDTYNLPIAPEANNPANVRTLDQFQIENERYTVWKMFMNRFVTKEKKEIICAFYPSNRIFHQLVKSKAPNDFNILLVAFKNQLILDNKFGELKSFLEDNYRVNERQPINPKILNRIER